MIRKPPYGGFYIWYKNGHIKNSDNFVTGIVTASDTQYPAKFDIFAGGFITNGQIDEIRTEIWGKWNYKQYNILLNGTSSDNELGFVKLLADSNSGLKVLRGSNNSNTWQELSIKNGQLDAKLCD